MTSTRCKPAGHPRRPPALQLLVLTMVLTTAQSLIDPISPNVARGIIGETAELACATTSSGNVVVVWIRARDHQTLSTNNHVLVDDRRISARSNGFEHTWFLDIENSTKEDEGEYRCIVDTRFQMVEKTVYLTMIEASNSLRWRPDNKCGPQAQLHGALSGKPAECDPLGAYPCCSGGGWCGFTRHHCDCSSCIDYRLINKDTTSTPATEKTGCKDEYQEVSSKCLLYSKDLKTWSEATQFCASQGGRLITFDTLDYLMTIVGNLTKLEMNKIDSVSPGVPVWVGVSTQGHKDPNGVLQWRWVMGRSELSDTSLLKHLATADGERCGYLSTDLPIATLRHTGDCDQVLLPLCEQDDN